jgi:hypothetical protein
VLLGVTNFWDRAEFLSMQQGFDIAVGATSVVTVCAHPHRLALSLNTLVLQKLTTSRSAIAMLACLYDRQVRNQSDIIDRITCTISTPSDDGTTPYFGALFRLLLVRYLSSAGHPPQLRGSVVEDGEWEKQSSNTLLRVGLLLEAATDTDLRPTSQTWSIKVGNLDTSFVHLHSHNV